jgi:hypothetical protein
MVTNPVSAMKTKDHVAVTALCVVNLCYLILSVVSATLLSSSSMPKCVWHLDIHMQGYRYDANSVRNFDKLWYILIFIKQMYIMMLLSMSDLVTSIKQKQREFRKYPEAGLVLEALDTPFSWLDIVSIRAIRCSWSTWCNVVKRYDIVVRSALPKNLVAYPCMQMLQ